MQPLPMATGPQLFPNNVVTQYTAHRQPNEYIFGNKMANDVINPMISRINDLTTSNNTHTLDLNRQMSRIQDLESGQINQDKAIVALQEQVKTLSTTIEQLGEMFKDYKDATDAKLAQQSRELERLRSAYKV